MQCDMGGVLIDTGESPEIGAARTCEQGACSKRWLRCLKGRRSALRGTAAGTPCCIWGFIDVHSRRSAPRGTAARAHTLYGVLRYLTRQEIRAARIRAEGTSLIYYCLTYCGGILTVLSNIT